jgi:Na+/H+-dicarboxylate symporter
LGRIGTETIVFFLSTTIAACLIGFLIGWVIQPGALIDGGHLLGAADPTARAVASAAEEAARQAGAASPPMTERIVSFLPANPHRALAEGDTLQVVIVAAILGLALLRVDRKTAAPLLDLMAGLQAVAMVVVQVAMRVAPIAVFGLMVRLAADLGVQAVAGLAVYVGCVLLGLALLLCLYLALAWSLAGWGPLRFLKTAREAMLLAFSTSSSAAVMPVSLRTAETGFRIRDGVARFVIPLGATVNMGGTALYQAVATLFLAQIFGIELGLGELGMILVMAVGAAIGSPGAPGVGIVILATILESVGIPAAGIALVIGVDRLLDMCRTVANVAGDLTAALVIDARTRPAPAGPVFDAHAPAKGPVA